MSFILGLEYNNSLALASLRLYQSPKAGSNFKILDKLHHKIGSIGKTEEDIPKFAQLYSYDQEREMENLLEHQTKKLKLEIIEILQSMLKENNPYNTNLNSVIDVCSENSNLLLALHADAKLKLKEAHTRSHNLPHSSTIWATVREFRCCLISLGQTQSGKVFG